eukprot:2410650-Pyramimonas_sp.AAC.1
MYWRASLGHAFEAIVVASPFGALTVTFTSCTTAEATTLRTKTIDLMQASQAAGAHSTSLGGKGGKRAT